MVKCVWLFFRNEIKYILYFLKKTQTQKAGFWERNGCTLVFQDSVCLFVAYHVLLFKVILPKKKGFALYFQHDCRYRIVMPLSLNDTGLLNILY